MPVLAHDAAPSGANRPARRKVIEYYDRCWDDYRILWRTDENGSVHFGFFDTPVPSIWQRLRAFGLTFVGMAAAAVAAVFALVGRRGSAIDWLRIAARGRFERHDRAQQRMTEVCAEAVGIRRRDRVLDAGCGIGGTDLWLAATYGARVHGVNVQPMHLRQARRRAADHPAGPRVRFSLQDFTEMAMLDASVDVVWALESVCHCIDKSAFVHEAYRVLRQGGRLMVADFFLSHEEIPAHRASAMQTWLEGWALPNLVATARFGSLLREHGFRDVIYRDIRLHVLPSSQRLRKAS
ncbi:MAG: class I SAM-dependent methyltransferase, partial [Vicinamibacterales bacterium]